MKLPSFALLPSVAILLGAALGILTTGCPQAGCPPCTIKKATFTISPADGEITDVVMRSTGEFTGHCAGEKDPDGCKLDDKQSLGVLKENDPQKVPMPWTSDRDDVLSVEIDVMRKTAEGTTVQKPPPKVEIVE